jgi:hypothetical protein
MVEPVIGRKPTSKPTSAPLGTGTVLAPTKATGIPSGLDAAVNQGLGNVGVDPVEGKEIDKIDFITNLTKAEMEAILTRLGTTGKIVINGDSSQRDTSESYTGLDFAIELSKQIEGIEWIKLQANHRSGLVGKILDYIYGK